MKINISKIQHFSVGDGEGIRTTVFFKGCNLSCPWCHNPENLSSSPCTMTYPARGITETLGKKTEPCEILGELLEDKDFYDQSGGGVTFSGGEVMLQAEGAAELSALLKKEGVSVFIDTAGAVPYSEFEKINNAADKYLYDIKTADPDKYRCLGGDLSLITDNLKRLIVDGKAVQVRIPLIPGFNTDISSIDSIGELLSSLKITDADLIPFHRLGSSKYEALGLEYRYRGTEPLSSDELEAIKKEYSKYLKIKVEK